MIKVSKNLDYLLSLVDPIEGVKRMKLSSYRHPFHAREDHDLVKERIMAYQRSVVYQQSIIND
jgi:hypothetical protein